MPDLEAIYRETLARCAPEILVRAVVRDDFPRAVVAIGKCGGALLDGVAAAHPVTAAFVAVPEGYRQPQTKAEVAVGGHPDYTSASFEAGEQLLAFVERHDDILFLISGGGSACVEVALDPPFRKKDLVETNRRLLASGLSIGEINVVRKQLSAIKGGRLAARVRGRSVTLIYSDVSTGRLRDVASGPTIAEPATGEDAAAILDRIGGCERIAAALRKVAPGNSHAPAPGASQPILVADNSVLTATAAGVARERGLRAIEWGGQLEDDVEVAASALFERVARLHPGEILVAGGEPTVVRRGSGRGGRCSELAVRFALRANAAEVRNVAALFGSSDGLDGSSGAAGVALDGLPAQLETEPMERDLADSDSMAAAVRLGRAIMIPPAGNNLRDLFLLARS